MANYIKQEMTDFSGEGKKKMYYRLQTKGNIDFKEFTAKIAQRNPMMGRGLVENVMSNVVDVLAGLIGEGYSVSIEGLGTFKGGIGLRKEKEIDTLDGNEAQRNAQSLELTNVNFKADKQLIVEANKRCKLKRGGISRLRQSPYSKEERLKLAQDHIAKHGAMKVADYVKKTGLSHTKATLELREFRRDASTGITTIGRRSTLVYVLKTEE